MDSESARDIVAFFSVLNEGTGGFLVLAMVVGFFWGFMILEQWVKRK